jgi:hypothetical protein
MPTRIATLGRERTVATLARRLYQIEGEGKAELQRRAEAALLAANPRLATAEGFRSGGRVVVPAVAGLTLSKEAAAADASGAGLVSEASLRLQALESRVEDRFKRASDQRQDILNKLDDRTFNAEAKKALPESVEHIRKTRERLKRTEEESKVAQEQLQKAIASALDGVSALEALFKKASPR